MATSDEDRLRVSISTIDRLAKGGRGQLCGSGAPVENSTTGRWVRVWQRRMILLAVSGAAAHFTASSSRVTPGPWQKRWNHSGEAEPKRPVFPRGEKAVGRCSDFSCDDSAESQSKFTSVIGSSLPPPLSTSWPSPPIQVPTLHLFRAGGPWLRSCQHVFFHRRSPGSVVALCMPCRKEMRFFSATIFQTDDCRQVREEEARVLPALVWRCSRPNNQRTRGKARDGYDRLTAGAIATGPSALDWPFSMRPRKVPHNVPLRYESMASLVWRRSFSHVAMAKKHRLDREHPSAPSRPSKSKEFGSDARRILSHSVLESERLTA